MRRRDHLVDMVVRELGGIVVGRPIAVLGAAFKPNSDDVRDSPALDVAGRLHLMGADVRVYDPEAMKNAAAAWPTLHFTDGMIEAVNGAELVIVATEWREFRDADPAALAAISLGRVVIDGRNCLNADAWTSAGWVYRGMGRYSQ